MKEASFDVWTIEGGTICITTNGFVKRNGECVMGRGIARQAKDRYPGIASYLGLMISDHGNHVHPLMYDGLLEIVSFPVKHHWREAADPALIERSAHELVEFVDKDSHFAQCYLPQPGCGNGQLNWADVKPIIEPILDDRFTVVSLAGKEYQR